MTISGSRFRTLLLWFDPRLLPFHPFFPMIPSGFKLWEDLSEKARLIKKLWGRLGRIGSYFWIRICLFLICDSFPPQLPNQIEIRFHLFNSNAQFIHLEWHQDKNPEMSLYCSVQLTVYLFLLLNRVSLNTSLYFLVSKQVYSSSL